MFNDIFLHDDEDKEKEELDNVETESNERNDLDEDKEINSESDLDNNWEEENYDDLKGGTEYVHEELSEIKEDNDEDLRLIEELLWEVSDNIEDNNTSNDTDISDKLEEATKLIKKLKERNSELQIENAELSRFGSEAELSPSLIIIKANYDKALEWDEWAISKIKKIILEDLWLEFVKPKETFFYDDIKSWVSYNSDEETSNNWYWTFI